jgi:amidase
MSCADESPVVAARGRGDDPAHDRLPRGTGRITARLVAGLALVAIGAVPSIALHAQDRPASPFDVRETTIPELRRAMERGNLTSAALVAAYSTRMERYRDLLNPFITINPDAMAEAERLDAERAAGVVRGPLHGVPIALKDNIQTMDAPTTGGALAFAGFVPPYDATVTRKLRDAGAVIIAKTVLTELANWVATGMPGNYSAVGGYGMNPYDPRPDPRAATNDGRPAMSVGGSSSGIGTSANLWVASIGTETSGSILTPSNQTMLVGLKPTVGRISRYGIIPLTADQDTPGPMTRTVTDAAILLGAMEGPDPEDPATYRCAPEPDGDYRDRLRQDALRGARIGIPRAFFYESITAPGAAETTGGLTLPQTAIMEEAIATMRSHGAIIVDPADIPSVLDRTEAGNLVRWLRVCTGAKAAGDANCSTVFKYGFKRDFNAWLETLEDAAPVKSLSELRAFNAANAENNAIRYGQNLLDNSDEIDLVADRARYEADRGRDLHVAGARGIDAALERHDLDALLFPGASAAGIAGRAGYPAVTVPFGTIPNAPANAPYPEDFDAEPQPYGVSFAGRACSEGRLLGLAFAFEQATRRRVPPTSVH